MKNFLQKKSLTFWLILVILLSIPSFSTLLQPGYFGMHDDIQVMRIYQMDKCVKDGQIPCRWVPDMGYGYGYPLFNYYPIMPYYLGEVIYLLGFSLIWSVKIVFILSFIVSAITIFLLGRSLWGNLGGLISSIFYVYAPYHGVDVYVRGALAESWSLAWTPAVFLMIYLIIEKFTLKRLMLLAVFVALFLTSHNPMALVFTPIMGIWALLLIWQKKKLKVLPYLALGGLWGLALAAFFSLPVILEGKLVHLETLFIGYFNYLAHFVGLNQLFISTFWGFGGSIWGSNDGMSFQIGWLHWGVILVLIPLAILLFKKDKFKSLILLFLIGVFWFATFLIHPRSNFIWEKLILLQTLQFPWRLLSVVIFVSSLSAGSLFAFPIKKLLKLSLFLVTLLAIAILYQPYFEIEKPIPLTDQEKLSGALWDLQRTAGIFDYLPKTAKFPPGDPALESIEVISGEAEIADLKKGTNWLEFRMESTVSATIRLPIIDFPQWKVFVDKKRKEFDNRNDLGQPTFEVSAGNHNIFAKLYDTPVRKISNIISIISFALLIFFLIKQMKIDKGGG